METQRLCGYLKMLMGADFNKEIDNSKHDKNYQLLWGKKQLDFSLKKTPCKEECFKNYCKMNAKFGCRLT